MGMRKQGICPRRSSIPSEMGNMLNVMTLVQPFSADQLAGMDRAWLWLGGKDAGRSEPVIGNVLERAEKYFLRGVCELSRLRLEASAPASRDITRGEVEVMRGLADHLGLIVLQQRGTMATLECDVTSLAREINVIQGLAAAVTRRDSGVKSSADVKEATSAWSAQMLLPPQKAARRALEMQRQGFFRAVESLREIRMLMEAMVVADPPSAAPIEKYDVECGQHPTRETDSSTAMRAVKKLEEKMSAKLVRLEHFPPPVDDALVESRVPGVNPSSHPDIVPLLGHEAMRVVVDNQETLRDVGKEAYSTAEQYAHVFPPSALKCVGDHCGALVSAIDSVLERNPLLRSYVSRSVSLKRDDEKSGACSPQNTMSESATKAHVSRMGYVLAEAVKALLLSVQGLFGEDAELDDRGPREKSIEDSTDELSMITLIEAHSRSFQQARALKLWRCVKALSTVRSALETWTEDDYANDGGDAGMINEAWAAAMALCGDVGLLAEQVLGAGKAILTGLVALNKVRE